MTTSNPRIGEVAWPAPGREIEYQPISVKALLRQGHSPQSGWFWAINPYRGCQYGCAFCDARLEAREPGSWDGFETRIGVKVNAVEVMAREMRDAEFAVHPVVLGTTTEPWQQAEEKLRLTRSILLALSRTGGVDLRVNTRSSLVARDTDLLRAIAGRGRVTVAFSLASIDERINRLLEPNAPSALRRFSAMEALARAGIDVALLVSPWMPGLHEDELGLAAMLTRAAHAGAKLAGMAPLQFLPGQRENFLQQVDRRYPELSTRFRRVIGRRSMTDEELAGAREAFERHCRNLDLKPICEAARPGLPARPPAQLSLFS